MCFNNFLVYFTIGWLIDLVEQESRAVSGRSRDAAAINR